MVKKMTESSIVGRYPQGSLAERVLSSLLTLAGAPYRIVYQDQRVVFYLLDSDKQSLAISLNRIEEAIRDVREDLGI